MTMRCTLVIESRPRGGHAAALPFDPKEVFGRARVLNNQAGRPEQTDGHMQVALFRYG